MREGVRSTFAGRRFEQRRPAVAWIVSGSSNATNELLIGALHERGVQAELARPAYLSDHARRDDTVLGRLDVRPTLDGVEDGLWELHRVERRDTPPSTRPLRCSPATTSCRRRFASRVQASLNRPPSM
jgi:hypothetical protein